MNDDGTTTLDSLSWLELQGIIGSSPKVILDVGANDGGTSRVFQTLFPTAVIHGFEADRRAIERCKNRLEHGNLCRGRFALHEVAISDGPSSFCVETGFHNVC